MALLGAGGTAGLAQQSDELPVLIPELQAVRAALDKYRDVVAAIHDGYLSSVGCLTFPEKGGPGRVQSPAGAMGVHFLNPALMSPEPDPLRPQILIYEPDGESLRLLAAEWFVPLATGVSARPVLFGQPFEGPMEGHFPLMPASLHHYDLHVWLWKPNPAGLFSPTNPAVQCPPTGYTFSEEAARIVTHH